MLTKWAIEGFSAVLSGLLNLLPSWERPDWFDTVLGYWQGVTAVHYFGNVVPLTAIVTAGTALVSATVLCTAISGSRTVFSMFTGGGGAK